MADQRFQATENVIGANHPTLNDTINRLALISHENDGTHKVAMSVYGGTTLTLPTSTDTLVGRATTDTLTNKTLTNPTINGFTGNTAVVNIGSGQIYKDASGNIGVGVTSPATKLHIYSTVNTLADLSGGMRVENASYTEGTYAGVLLKTGDTLNAYFAARRGSSYGGEISIGVNEGGDEDDLVEVINILSNGNVGLGTVPAERLDVNGNVRCDGLRIDASPSVSSDAVTHKLAVNLNGTTYYLLLSNV